MSNEIACPNCAATLRIEVHHVDGIGGFVAKPSVTAPRHEHQIERFVQAVTVPDADAWIETKLLYKLYVRWCVVNGEAPRSPYLDGFGRMLSRYSDFGRARTSSTRYVTGRRLVSVTPPDDDPLLAEAWLQIVGDPHY